MVFMSLTFGLLFGGRVSGLRVDQARRFKELENIRLKRLVADLSLDKAILKDAASGNL